MKHLLILLVILLSASANANYAHTKDDLESVNLCQKCHPAIYDEWSNSAHSKSSIYEDKIHAAIWNKHPKKKQEKYVCAKCHTPTDSRILDALKSGKSAMPQPDNYQIKEAISCVYCHSIKSINENAKSNSNLLTKDKKIFFAADNDKKGQKLIFKKEKTLFGLTEKTVGSAYHDIDYSNEIFYNGKVCMGCHSHKQNGKGFELCKTDYSSNAQKNCISCHMPKILGSKTTVKTTKKHTFHGFAGSQNKHEMLSKYVKISFKQSANGFDITIKNEASHDLLLHPLRVLKLDIYLHRDSKKITLASKSFFKVIGTKGKPSAPWLATQLIKNNMIKANESRVISYKQALKKGDSLEVKLGYYLVNPKMLNKLNLQNETKAKKFFILKSQRFTVDK